MRLLAEELAHHRLDFGNTRGPADENDLVDLGAPQRRVLDRLLARGDCSLEDVVDELLELGSGQLEREVLRTAGVGGDEWQVDLGLDGRGELDLRLFRGFLEPLERHAILGQIDAIRFRELVDDPVDDALVDVVAAKVGIAVRRLHLDDAFPHFQNGDVERASAEIEDGDFLVPLLVEPISEGGSGGLVHEPHDLEARDLSRVLRRLALAVVEIGGDSDDRLVHLLAEVVLRGLLELLEDHGGELGRRVLASLDVDPCVPVLRLHDFVGHHLHLLGDLVGAASHEPFDGKHGVLGVRDRLSFGYLSHEPLVSFGESDHGRRRSPALRIRDHGRAPPLHDRHDRVRRSQVDPDDLAHFEASSKYPIWRVSLTNP